MAFVKAQKYGAKLRMAISGPAGAGKTWTALTLAEALAEGQCVAVIDTEHRSASKYADRFEFDVAELETFHPQRYIDAIHEAEAGGYAVLVIDSLSHAWSGQGGLLEEKDKIARQKYGGNSFSAWNDASALQNKLVQAILGSKLHIIATVRAKMEYLQERDEKGKSSVRKVGMAPVQRDDLPYEFDVFCSMEVDNTLIVDKSRCPALTGAIIAKPDASMAEMLKDWLSGEASPAPRPSPLTAARPGEVRNAPMPADDAAATEQQLSSIRKLCERLGRPEPDDLAALSFAEAKARIVALTREYLTGKASQSAPAPPQPLASHAAPTPEDVERMKAYMGRVYNFKQKDFDARWQACKVHVLGKPVADPDLSAGDLAALRRFAQEREKEQLSAANVSGK